LQINGLTLCWLPARARNNGDDRGGDGLDKGEKRVYTINILLIRKLDMFKGNRTKKEKKQVEQIVSDAIEQNPNRTLDELAEIVNSELGFKPARLTMMRIMAGLGKTAKRVTRWEDE